MVENSLNNSKCQKCFKIVQSNSQNSANCLEIDEIGTKYSVHLVLDF